MFFFKFVTRGGRHAGCRGLLRGSGMRIYQARKRRRDRMGQIRVIYRGISGCGCGCGGLQRQAGTRIRLENDIRNLIGSLQCKIPKKYINPDMDEVTNNRLLSPAVARVPVRRPIRGRERSDKGGRRARCRHVIRRRGGELEVTRGVGTRQHIKLATIHIEM